VEARRDTTARRIACFATQGSGSRDEARVAALLADLRPTVLAFDHGSRAKSAVRLFRRLGRLDPDIVVMEGTGVGGGLVVLADRLLRGRPYIVSSGDAVGPYVGLVSPSLAGPAGLYERLLCARSAGFIGWSPYLVGRALTFRAPRAMTAPNWAHGAPPGNGRRAVRSRLGIPDDAIVFGIVGSLQWDRRHAYCYGAELVRAAARVHRQDLHVLVVGAGDGQERLQALVGGAGGAPVHLTGAVPRDEVAAHLAAMDVASLPQSVDGVGAFRYTTKISEYIAAGLPIVTTQIPLAYDLDDGALWRLPGDAPWDERFLGALTELMAGVRHDDVASRRPPPEEPVAFSRSRQQRQVTAFVSEVLERDRARGRRSRIGAAARRARTHDGRA
jgi:glycosyltransferase involved in cell wall biosynthesis